jgi:hypothetical protein
MTHLRRRLMLSLLLLAVGILLVPASALAAPSAPASPANCAPLRASPNATAHPVATVYYVVAWPGVNVRHGPGRGYCVLATQGYTANVVAVPGVPEVWNTGYWWREVAYDRGGGPAAPAYSWSAVGWVAAPFLRQATSGAPCVAARCQLFATDGKGWSLTSRHLPNTWDDYGCLDACRYGPVWSAWACALYGQPATGDLCGNGEPYGNGFGQSGALGAATENPNWFVVGYQPGNFYTLLWQYTWWLS